MICEMISFICDNIIWIKYVLLGFYVSKQNKAINYCDLQFNIMMLLQIQIVVLFLEYTG